MHLFLFFLYLVQFLIQEHGVHGKSACSLEPIDKKVRKLEYSGRYYLGEDLVTQPEAEICCKSKQLTLATIISDEDSALVSRLYALSPKESETGETSTGQSVWVSSDVQIKKYMAAVGDGPCSSIAIEVYLMDFTRIVIEGSGCEAKKQYLCEDRDMGTVQTPPPVTEEFGYGSLYSKTKVRWSEAKTYCSGRSKILLNLLTESEKDSILQHIEKTEEGKAGIWTSGFKDPAFGYKWSSGMAVEIPIEGKDENNCLKLVTENAAEKKFSYVTEDCTKDLPFVCTEKIVPADIKELTAEVGRSLDGKVRSTGPIGPDLSKEQKQACMAEEPEKVQGTNTLYCMRQNLSWRQALSCCKLKGMNLASFRSTEEALPAFSCSNVFETIRKDSKYRGPWTNGNNFQWQDYHWFNGTTPEDAIKEDIWIDIWDRDSDKGSCVHFHGTNKSNTDGPNHNLQNPKCKDGICWGLITADCYRQTTVICRKSSTDSATTPSPPVVTTAAPPVEVTTAAPPVKVTTAAPPVKVTTAAPPVEVTTSKPPVTTGSPPKGTTPHGPVKCPPRPIMGPCRCDAGGSPFILGNQTVTVDTKFGVTYAISKTKETFFQSIQSCRRLNMTLLAIEFPEEDIYVRSTRKPLDADLWTSGVTTKSGKLIQWMGTGRYVHYRPKEFKPDVSVDKCVAISSDATWILSECKTKNYYMCEFRVR